MCCCCKAERCCNAACWAQKCRGPSGPCPGARPRRRFSWKQARTTNIGVINGALPVNFWTLHSFQISATLDMLLFMRVLGLRTKELHTKVQHANQQLDAMH